MLVKEGTQKKGGCKEEVTEEAGLCLSDRPPSSSRQGGYCRSAVKFICDKGCGIGLPKNEIFTENEFSIKLLTHSLILHLPLPLYYISL